MSTLVLVRLRILWRRGPRWERSYHRVSPYVTEKPTILLSLTPLTASLHQQPTIWSCVALWHGECRRRHYPSRRSRCQGLARVWAGREL